MYLEHRTWPHTRAAVVDRIRAESGGTILFADIMLSADSGAMPLFVLRLIHSHVKQRALPEPDLGSPLHSALRRLVQLRVDDSDSATGEREAAWQFVKACGAFDKMVRAVMFLHAIEELLAAASPRSR